MPGASQFCRNIQMTFWAHAVRRERKSPIGYHFSLFASQRMQAWQAFERGCLSWI